MWLALWIHVIQRKFSWNFDFDFILPLSGEWGELHRIAKVIFLNLHNCQAIIFVPHFSILNINKRRKYDNESIWTGDLD